MIVFSSSDCRYSFISHGLVNGPVTEYLCSQIFVILTVPLPNQTPHIVIHKWFVPGSNCNKLVGDTIINNR